MLLILCEANSKLKLEVHQSEVEKPKVYQKAEDFFYVLSN